MMDVRGSRAKDVPRWAMLTLVVGVYIPVTPPSPKPTNHTP